MEVGTGMMFPVSVVDGLVHQLGGMRLEVECRFKQAMAGGGEACPVGQVVLTSAGGLKPAYEVIVHTTPPFFKHDSDPTNNLRSCYKNSLQAAFTRKHSRVACPLLGAGARGFAEPSAVDVAIEMTKQWTTEDSPREQAIVFGVMEQSIADLLIERLDE